MKRNSLLVLAFLLCGRLWAQESYPINGVQDKRLQRHAFTNANIYVDYQTQLSDATLLIEDGKVVAVGKDLKIPAGTIVEDLQGKWIYPGLIDPYTSYGITKLEEKDRPRYATPQMESSKEGAYAWNEAIRSHFDAVTAFDANEGAAKELRDLGFGAVLAHRNDGIARGTGTLVALADEDAQEVILLPKASAHFSFDKGTSNQEYPSSLMGAIALLRQTHLDSRWYNELSPKPFTDQSLGAFYAQYGMPQIFEADEMLSALRADKLGDEFGVQYIIRGNGDEYKRLGEIKQTGGAYIIPLDFPEAYEVEDPLDEMNVSLSQMKHWEMAPYNPALLAKEEVPFAITTDGLKDKSKFWPNLRKAVDAGLSKEAALKALTYTPANLLNAEEMVGSLEKGRQANFIITSGDLFEDETVIYQNWVQGNPYQLNDMAVADVRGQYKLQVGGESYPVEVSGKMEKPAFKLLKNDTTKYTINTNLSDNLITLTFNPKPEDSLQNHAIRLSGWRDGQNWKGSGRLANGEKVDFNLLYEGALEEEEEKEKEEKTAEEARGQIIYPFVAYGYTEIPEAKTYLIKNATVWTNEEAGIVENTDVLVENGKISKIGQNLSAKNAVVIDGTGKHLTSGIIDEHSHIAIEGGVNEGTQAVTSEVRIGDVVSSEDVNIYRQLAGGVTASQLLHGSANPIGGQSALIKLRWGKTPEEMKIEGADEYIKFALGENVKQSNWGPHYDIRFPQSRMGVEQVMVDAFNRAKAYEQEWKTYNSLSKKEKQRTDPPRKDLELEALVEILNDDRFITSHSYVQSEINMLMEVAEKYGFNVNTFTHILEGYKLADKMAKHGAGGSTFADWWVYKMEVQEAIPYNAALMHGEGVVTAINSDDAEMARRLNQEAAKTVKYGGVSEEEAWKMVTLNPAKLLHLDDRMGSVKAGKDADLVLWNNNPLSIYAKPLKTMVDGVVYFDIEKDKEMREAISQERARLISEMREAKEGGESTQKARPEAQHIWHCEDLHGLNKHIEEVHNR
ncbi:amidohydrolase family protein [Nafulsella turpanensis]|uniref:amidohydrolase family protein n=1 Tax=Nafulsella turpanensis TaxID=1265690 RepID=UPI000349C7F3|nr:amidohydrolase family protein [Nafulsella turpanensis]